MGINEQNGSGLQCLFLPSVSAVYKECKKVVSNLCKPCYKTSYKCGFTLAELLVGIGIIGVISVLTISTLVTNYQKSRFEVSIRRIASLMDHAVMRLLSDERVQKVSLTSLLSSGEDYSNEAYILGGKFLDKYFNVADICQTADQCFAQEYRSARADHKFTFTSTWNSDKFKDSCRVLADGTSICVMAGGPSVPVNVQLDLNGKRGPNRYGYDSFVFSIYYDGSISELNPEHRDNEEINGRVNGCLADGNSYGSGCFLYLQNNGFKIDY